MAGLLYGKEMDQVEKLFEKVYNLNSKTVYFPIRHHSPACSFHLMEVIARYKPEIILIEGPSDANGVIPYLVNTDSKTPLCIYYSYIDRRGFIGAKDRKYSCYYPFLEYSPEYAAMKEAEAKGIKVKFIDLPYPESLIRRKDDGELTPNLGNDGYDDELMASSQYIEELCKIEGCRNFHELWEKLYEIEGLQLSTENFVKNMFAFCYYSRIGCSKKMLIESGNLAREQYMALNIRDALSQYERVLVVTGGFHTPGLLDLMEESLKSIEMSYDSSNTGVYPMAFSFEESDQLKGYESGMPYPAFYQKIWENQQKHEEKPYQKAVLDLIIRCGLRIKKDEGGLSTTDEIEAFNMAKGLSSLRNKRECGVYELIDGMKASFIKGEFSVSNSTPMKVLSRLLSGKKVGKLCEGAATPPIVQDFKETALKLNLKINSTVEQELVLNVLKRDKHRRISQLLHRMSFLNTGFCSKVKGANLINKKNMGLVREVWKYRWTTTVESRLVELSIYGGSLEEAAEELLKEKLQDCGQHSGEASLLLLEAYLMELTESIRSLETKIELILHKDGMFYSVADCAYNLSFLAQSRWLFNSLETDGLNALKSKAYYKAVSLIPGLFNIDQAEEDIIISRLKDIYYVSTQIVGEKDGDILGDALRTLINLKDCNSSIEGAAIGLLFGMNKISRDFVIQRAEGYFYGTGDNLLKSAEFLKGLFSTARDTMLYDERLIQGMNNVLKNIDEDRFLEVLPSLRLSFSFFNPGEIDDLGKKVSKLLKIPEAEMVKEGGIDPKELKRGIELDTFTVNTMKKWGILNE